MVVDEQRSAGWRTPRRADRRRALDRGERLSHSSQRRDAAFDQLYCPLLRKVLREGGRDHAGGAGRPRRPIECGDRRLPVRVVAAVGAREVEQEHGRVEASPREGGEGLGERRLVAPTEGVVVERIGDGDEGVHGGADRGDVPGGEVGERQPGLFDGVGQHRRLAARAAHRADPHAAEGAVHMEQLQRFEQLRNAVHAGESEPAQERAGAGVRSGDGRGVGEVGGPCALRAAGLHDHHRHRPLPRLVRECLEPRHRVEPFDMQSDGAHALVIEQRPRQVPRFPICAWLPAVTR